VTATDDTPDAGGDGAMMTSTQAAEQLGVSVMTLRRYVEAGELRASRIGPKKLIRIRPADLAAYVEANQTPTPAAPASPASA
jgi:excisionase family DNA binding protein